jgi:hypothetical protein
LMIDPQGQVRERKKGERERGEREGGGRERGGREKEEEGGERGMERDNFLLSKPNSKPYPNSYPHLTLTGKSMDSKHGRVTTTSY